MTEENLREFFHPAVMQQAEFPNFQNLDWEGIVGKLRSASYIPLEGSARYEDMIAELRELFTNFAENGMVSFLYDTQLYWARID